MGISVQLINKPTLVQAAAAARICTDTMDKLSIGDVMDGEEDNLLKRCLKMGHESIFEHVVYTFHIKGVTRALLQELARHRHISLSVKSTRYTLGKMTSEDIDKISLNLEQLTHEHTGKLGVAHDLARELLEELVHLKREEKIQNDVLKYFLPEAVTTELMMTVNARELRHIFKLRAAPNALKEFSELCVLLKTLIVNEYDHHEFLYVDCTNWDKTEERIKNG